MFTAAARDWIERNITLFMLPWGEPWRQRLAQSGDPDYIEISKTMYTSPDWVIAARMYMVEMLVDGTHGTLGAHFTQISLDWAAEYDHVKGKYVRNFGRGYHWGERLRGHNPQTGYLTNRKWHLNEVNN